MPDRVIMVRIEMITEQTVYYRQLQKLLRTSLAAAMAVMLLLFSSISMTEGHGGLCHDLARQITDRHTECHHEDDVCAESDKSHHHQHDYLNIQTEIRQATASCFLRLTVPNVFPVTFVNGKPEARPPEKSDRLRHHESQVLLI